MTLKTDIDDFDVHGREVYWLCQKKQSESTFSNAVLEKTLGIQATLRASIRSARWLINIHHQVRWSAERLVIISSLKPLPRASFFLYLKSIQNNEKS